MFLGRKRHFKYQKLFLHLVHSRACCGLASLQPAPPSFPILSHNTSYANTTSLKSCFKSISHKVVQLLGPYFNLDRERSYELNVRAFVETSISQSTLPMQSLGHDKTFSSRAYSDIDNALWPDLSPTTSHTHFRLRTLGMTHMTTTTTKLWSPTAPTLKPITKPISTALVANNALPPDTCLSTNRWLRSKETLSR